MELGDIIAWIITNCNMVMIIFSTSICSSATHKQWRWSKCYYQYYITAPLTQSGGMRLTLSTMYCIKLNCWQVDILFITYECRSALHLITDYFWACILLNCWQIWTSFTGEVYVLQLTLHRDLCQGAEINYRGHVLMDIDWTLQKVINQS